MSTDAELLHRFRTSGDEAAFRDIVERHAPMVRGVAWRRLQDRSLAEDIVQCVFTALARKAGGLRHHELAGWLHRCAFLETCNVSRREARRRGAMQELMTHTTMTTAPENEEVWREIRPHLDEALSRLSPANRQLIVMRYLEDRSYPEITKTAGGTDELNRKRMQRSLQQLADLLRKRGIMTSGAALGSLMAGQQLGVLSASAAAGIATAALAGVSAAGSASLILKSIILMTSSTLVKTATVTAVAAVVCLLLIRPTNSPIGAEPDVLNESESTSETVETPLKQQPVKAPVEAAPAAVVQVENKPASAPVPPPPEPASLDSWQISAELKKLKEPLAQAIADQIRRREMLVDLPDYCAFKVPPINAEAAADIEKKINDIKASAAPDARQYTEKACASYLWQLEEARQSSVVEVMVDENGLADVQVSRTPMQLPVKFDKWGRYVSDVTGFPGVEVVQSSSGWGPYMEGLYGEARAGKLKQTMAELKARAMEE